MAVTALMSGVLAPCGRAAHIEVATISNPPRVNDSGNHSAPNSGSVLISRAERGGRRSALDGVILCKESEQRTRAADNRGVAAMGLYDVLLRYGLVLDHPNRFLPLKCRVLIDFLVEKMVDSDLNHRSRRV
ncbi:hypothetical protein EH228_09900 [Erwinia endophytica]|uniref:hypothetical protein n=1 Tax=Erwinia endophytica TaxID=1563158 RepID=UPI001265EDEE|nr:hypothetical protein [Erwinia endophytica]KAB8310737.1 hypothetical protein EH228_09900 [Erwinia endophytica]